MFNELREKGIVGIEIIMECEKYFYWSGYDQEGNEVSGKIEK